MNVRLTVASLGAIILLLGVAGTMRPLMVAGMLGFVIDSAHTPFALGEVRATYGGLFGVMGLVLLWAAVDPFRYRDRLLAIGLCWIGACAARLLGASVDGPPGALGWFSAAFEATVGLLLVVGSLLAAPPPGTTAAPEA
jgi:hypothetical protein